MSHLRQHICFFIGSVSGRGGTEKISIGLANSLVENGYNVSVISLSADTKTFFDIDKRIKLYSLFKSPKNYTLYFPLIGWKLYKQVKALKIDILVDVDVILSLFSLPVKLFNKKLKIISWEHFNYKTNLGVKRRDFARQLAKTYADTIVTLTEQDRKFYLEDGRSKVPVVFISNFLESMPDSMASLENKTVISVGRFAYQKGFDILIDVWKLVKLNSISKDWYLKIIGDGADKNTIKAKIKNLGLKSSIDIVDATSGIGELYLSSSLYVMTSRFEGLPMVLLEAESYGLPIISFDCLTGPGDIIRDGENGYLVPLGELQLMADKIIALMTDPSKRKAMGERAREDAFRFLKEVIVQKWEQLFDEIG
jgi:glycosyltransferase involved in cell wall biosynthesis